MGTEQLLVGNLAVSAVIIKSIVSAIKTMFPMKPLYTQIAIMLLGVSTAFIMDITLVESASTTGIAIILQKILAGLFVGASSMGIHETTKVIKKNAK